MTTIPSRYSNSIFWDQINYLKLQKKTFEKLFISIPNKYKRFTNHDDLIIDQDIYPWIDIIKINEDYGPSSKFLAPLLYRFDEIKTNILIIIDDDRYYDVNMTRLYFEFFESNPNIYIASGNPELYNNIHYYERMDNKFLDIRPSSKRYVSGFMSWSMNLSQEIKFINVLIEYTLKILKHVPDSFYHDEGILVNFMWFFNIIVYYINFKFINVLSIEHPDALCLSDSFFKRKNIEYDIFLYSKFLFPNIDFNFFHIHPSLRTRRKFILGS